MVDQNIEQETSDAVNSVENALASLWDKAREASLLISTLREERKRLSMKIEELEEELHLAKQEVLLRQTRIDALTQELHSGAATAKQAVNLDAEEKRQLQQRLRNVLSKLDQYLAP